ncbi:membrane-spanning 4-domains subfamily A member 6A isoform X2 [Erinaceus europaeus]|uniref:Membrane-spanning 4-domains subfamily A member 6A isoform X2 n=1 Tax=Erinaceus europaeus TaxID=9365 RepID=A0ABM3W6P9_ERIEU|nr:membrane-spanning 4-domains subfamily A member 6A isoform X2 [Erinaceus europaeus]
MSSQPVTREAMVVLTPDGIRLPQAEKPNPINQNWGYLRKYVKAEVKVLGHFTNRFSSLWKAAYPFAGAMCFITSGCLAIITEKKSTKILVQCSLVANLLSSLIALVGFLLLSVNLASLDSALENCDLTEKEQTHEQNETSYYRRYYHDDYCGMANAILDGTLSVLLICTTVELCLAVLSAVVWWKQVQSDFPGSVFFLPQSYRNDYIPSKANFDSPYEELVT